MPDTTMVTSHTVVCMLTAARWSGSVFWNGNKYGNW